MVKKIHGRHGARWVAMQGLYAWQLSDVSISRIEQDLREGNLKFDQPGDEPLKVSFDGDYLHELLSNIAHKKHELDELMLPFMDREVEKVHPIEHAILWIAFYELKDRPETPYKVIINEAVLLAKQFGAQDSHKFVNGVLDKAAQSLRAKELLTQAR